MGVFSKSRPKSQLSNQEAAILKRNKSLLDEEIGEGEKRLKAMARGKLGYASLLGNPKEEESGPAGPGYTPFNQVFRPKGSAGRLFSQVMTSLLARRESGGSSGSSGGTRGSTGGTGGTRK